MKIPRLRKLVAGALVCAALAGLFFGANPGTRLDLEPAGVRLLAQESNAIHLPLLGRNYLSPAYRLSRFGVGAPRSVTTSVPISSLNDLNAGWYLDWFFQKNPSRPGGVSFAQMVRLRPDGSSKPSGAALDAVVRANPGALWLIGNEPDSPYQDNVTPEVYARAYHDLYYQIKAADPTALVSAGGIVQPTPLRLKYLDFILEAYRALYPEEPQMPVDVWNIHIHILREVAKGRPDSWGAFIPPGLPDEEGKLYEIQDHDNIEIFKEMVVRFREWMARNGYRDRPLIITEFGVIMPWDILVGDPKNQAAGDARVLAFMDASIDFLLTKTDAAIGYPYDGNRLVQRWAWYALVGSWSGWLFEDTGEMSVFGQRYAALAAAQPKTVNLLSTRLATTPASGIRVGAAGVRVQATLVNNGNIPTMNPVAVRFYDGNPDRGGVQIGETQYILSIDGGAGLATVSVPWTPAEAKTYQLYVRADPLNNIPETDEGDNTRSINVVVSQ